MKRICLTAVLIFLLVSLLPACSKFGFVTGTGDISSRTYNFDDFTEIEIGSAFEFEISPSDSYHISITAPDNLFYYIDVSRTEETLKVRMKPGSYTNASRKVTITLPRLLRLYISGASRGSVKGFMLTDKFHLVESGASSLDIEFQSAAIEANISGASKTTGKVQTADLKLDVSAASRVDLTGSADNVTLVVSGASQANLPELSGKNARVNISGASRSTVTVTGTLDIDLSGASSLTYGGSPALGKVNVTGASSLINK